MRVEALSSLACAHAFDTRTHTLLRAPKDIPLLYETKGEAACDGVAVVSAPAAAQRARVLARPGMSEEKLAAILVRQVGAGCV